MPHLIDHASDLEDLARLAAAPGRLDDVLSRALEALGDLVPYDLAAVLELSDGLLEVRAARGSLATDAVRQHRLVLGEHPTLRRALEGRQPLALTDHDHGSDEGDPYDGVLDLPHGHSCMVVPLWAEDRDLGVITLDRTLCQPYEDDLVRLAGVVGRIVSLAIAYAQQAALLDRARTALEERQRLLEADTHGDPDGRLTQLPSAPMRHAVQLARQVATTDAPVLLQGETGSGKEVLARAIHSWSARSDGPFVALNCGAIPEGLVESELFGHVQGAFSGATRDRPGRFVAANGGTLLLDEVAELPSDAQSSLLRVLQEGTFHPVGSDDVVRVDVRVIAASHVDLQQAVAAGRFREDLYYRLAVFPLVVPPLRERPEDLPLLARRILDELHARSGRGPWQIAPDLLEALAARPWPGNVRELRNALERATILATSGVLTAGCLTGPAAPAPQSTGAPTARPVPLAQAERAHIERALRFTGGKVWGEQGAAALLELPPSTLQSRMKKLGIDRRAFSG